jgi:integrase
VEPHDSSREVGLTVHPEDAALPVSGLPIDERIRFFRAQASALHTRRAYASDLAHFASWGGLLPRWPDASGAEGPDRPTDPAQLERYLAEHGDRLRITTLRRRVAAIQRWHRHTGHPAPGRDPRVGVLLAGIARAQAQARGMRFRVRRAPPLLERHLRALLDVTASEDPRALRDRALFLLAWSLGARRSELLRLEVDDVRFEPDGVDVSIAFSKTDPEARGTTLGIPRVDGRGCAVRALEDWLGSARLRSGFLFRRIDRWGRVAHAPLCDESLGRILKRRLAQAGVAGAERFSAHSFRAGMITQGILQRADSAEVQERSRHRSRDVFQQYVRESPARADSFVAAMLRRL